MRITQGGKRFRFGKAEKSIVKVVAPSSSVTSFVESPVDGSVLCRHIACADGGEVIGPIFVFADGAFDSVDIGLFVSDSQDGNVQTTIVTANKGTTRIDVAIPIESGERFIATIGNIKPDKPDGSIDEMWFAMKRYHEPGEDDIRVLVDTGLYKGMANVPANS